MIIKISIYSSSYYIYPCILYRNSIHIQIHALKHRNVVVKVVSWVLGKACMPYCLGHPSCPALLPRGYSNMESAFLGVDRCRNRDEERKIHVK